MKAEHQPISVDFPAPKLPHRHVAPPPRPVDPSARGGRRSTLTASKVSDAGEAQRTTRTVRGGICPPVRRSFDQSPRDVAVIGHCRTSRPAWRLRVQRARKQHQRGWRPPGTVESVQAPVPARAPPRRDRHHHRLESVRQRIMSRRPSHSPEPIVMLPDHRSREPMGPHRRQPSSASR